MILNRTLSEQDKVLQLLDAVEKSIRQDTQNFYKFLDVLGKNSSMEHLSGKLKVACGEYCNDTCLITGLMHCVLLTCSST